MTSSTRGNAQKTPLVPLGGRCLGIALVEQRGNPPWRLHGHRDTRSLHGGSVGDGELAHIRSEVLPCQDVFYIRIYSAISGVPRNDEVLPGSTSEGEGEEVGGIVERFKDKLEDVDRRAEERCRAHGGERQARIRCAQWCYDLMSIVIGRATALIKQLALSDRIATALSPTPKFPGSFYAPGRCSSLQHRPSLACPQGRRDKGRVVRGWTKTG
ncbi:hypothetical protein BC834DRAFT_525307 [Gloeopeniophorella convolvens]|nr:hypothetical protein BC834DRAFT_525307 [Gloeopeniophorella convolvens]